MQKGINRFQFFYPRTRCRTSAALPSLLLCVEALGLLVETSDLKCTSRGLACHVSLVCASLLPSCLVVCGSETGNTVSAAKIKLNPEGPFPQHNIEMRRLAGAGMCYIQAGECRVGCSRQACLLLTLLCVVCVLSLNRLLLRQSFLIAGDRQRCVGSLCGQV